MCLEFAEGVLRAVATDGRCLATASEAATGPGLEAPKSVRVGDEERSLAPVVPLGAVRGLMEVLKCLDPNRTLTLGFTPGGRFQLAGEGLSVSARLLEGRFPAWREALPPASPWSARVDPHQLREAVKGLSRFTVPGERTMRVRLEGPTLTLSVANAEASSSAVVPVRNLSERPGEVATTDLDPRYLLSYLDAERSSFVLRFPPGKGHAMACEGEGLSFLLMPMSRD